MKEEERKIIDMVKKGVSGKEIMNEFGIKSKTALKKIYYDALVKAGKIKDIQTARKVKNETQGKKTFSITKRGTISLSKMLLVDNFGFKEGDTFTVSKRKDSIILRKEEKGS